MSGMAGGRSVPKVVGFDVELHAMISGPGEDDNTGREAALRLLAEFDGVLAAGRRSVVTRCAANGAYFRIGQADAGPVVVTDEGRLFLPNGGSAYIDLDHLEIASPEVTSAADHVAAFHGMLQLVGEAQELANRELPAGTRIQAHASNSDLNGHAWGAHLNILVTRDCYETLFGRRLHYAQWLAGYQAGSVIITGQGKVGSENGRPGVDFQLSQRADYFSTMFGAHTTGEFRPMLNTRDEALAGDGLARVHYIPCDSNLCHWAGYLKIGILQVLLAMIEAKSPLIEPAAMLEDPVAAFGEYSRDPWMGVRQRTLDGGAVTSLEHQQRVCDAAAAFVESGGCDDTVPECRLIIDRWRQVLDALARGDMAFLLGRLDWVLKRALLADAIADEPGLTWASPELKLLDMLYSSLEPGEGLFQRCEAAGMVAPVVGEDRIRHLAESPPDDTRAWTRGNLVSLLEPDTIDAVNWHYITVGAGDRANPLWLTIEMPDPLGYSRKMMEPLFDAAGTADQLLAAFLALARGSN